MKRLVKWVAFSVVAVATLMFVQTELMRLLTTIRGDSGSDIRSWLVLGHIGGTIAAFAITGALLGLEGYLGERIAKRSIPWVAGLTFPSHCRPTTSWSADSGTRLQ